MTKPAGIKEFMKLNEEQEAVLNLDNDIIVEAGAGSGKTRALVARYLHILEQGRAGVDEIVAITFTENAAAEMRDRIRHEVKEYIRLNGERNFLSKKAIKKLPHARISTIHGFSARILKENPLESMLIPGFKVIEGIERNIFIEETLKDFITRLWGSKKDSEKQLLLDVLEEEGFDQRKSIQRLSAIISWSCRLHLEQPWKIFSDRELNVEDEGPLRQLLIKSIESDLKDSPNGAVQKRIDSIRKIAGEFRKSGSNSQKARHVNKIRKNCEKMWALSGMSEEEKAFASDFLQIANQLLNIYDTRLNQIYLPLAEEAYRFLNRRMSESGFLDYESLLVRGRDLLKNNRELLDYYRRKIKFIMVDEFQDTDSLQYELISLIAQNGGANRFIVGDPTQSIFRFRGGDPAVFKSLKDSEIEIKRLSYNYRSERRLIDFYNKFFRSLLPQGYQDMQAMKVLQPERSNMEFIVTVESSTSEWRNEEAENIARRILQLREQGRAYKDIALIFRSKKYIYIYENALREHQIPFTSASGSGFFGRSEIRDVVVFLKYLLNPKDKIAEACVLRSPFCGASDSELLSYYYHEHEIDKISTCLALVKKIRNEISLLTPLRLIERLLEATGYDACVLALPEGRVKHANLTKLISIFGRLESLGYGIQEMLDYLDSSSGEDTEPLAQSELEEDSVKLLTVHKAKGLEFPVVFLADLNHGSGGGREDMLARREEGFFIRHEGVQSELWKKIAALEEADNMQEEMRSLYVAKTRAKELLIMAVGGDRDEEGRITIRDKQSFAGLLSSVFDFPWGMETKDHVEFGAMRIPVWTSSDVEGSNMSEEKDYIEPAGLIGLDEIKKRFTPISVPEEDEDEEDRIQRLAEVNVGTLMHRFLEIWDFEEGSIDAHVNFVLNEGYVPSDQFDQLKSQLGAMGRKFFNSELSRRINNARRVYREVPFYFLVDEKPRRGRVDLVLDEQTGPVLFDYKHANKEEDLLQYKDQIERYAKVVERRFGTAPTEKFFVLLPRVELVKV